MPYADKQAQKLYDQKKYKRNRKKILARRKIRHERNREQENKYCRDYVKRNRSKLNAYRRKWRLTRSGKSKARELATSRAWRKRNAKKLLARNARYARKHQQKHIAHACVRAAIEAGLLIRPRICSKCGKSGRIEAHHPNYSKPLQVVWLCASVCHKEVHAKP